MSLCRLVPCRTLTLTAKLRSPSIRFRYGASREQQKSPPPPSSSVSSAQATQASSEPIYDFQLPQRFKRRPLSEEEIAYINRGGPE